MQRRKNACSGIADDVENLQLMTDVEVVRRFIEDHEAGVLDHRPRQGDTFTLLAICGTSSPTNPMTPTWDTSVPVTTAHTSR